MRSHPCPATVPEVPPRAARLSSDDGAVDVSSVIIGAVLVGAIALGVAANTLGLLPWGRDMQAKQDLGAIRTAETTVATQDGSGLFRDLDGLNERNLLSDVDPDRTEITTFFGGRQYMAAARSKSGKAWFITSENPSPRLLEDTPGDPAEPAGPYTLKTSQWASKYCTPKVIERVEWTYMRYADQSMAEVLKMMNGLPYDEGILNGYFSKYGVSPGDGDKTEEAVIADLLWASEALRKSFETGITAVAPGDFPAAAATHLAALDKITIPFCQGDYPGPAPYPEHNFKVSQPTPGSNAPATFSVTLSGEGSERFNVELSAADQGSEWGSPAQEFTTVKTYGLVAGVPTWTLTVTPGPSGWVEGGYLGTEAIITHVNGSPMWKPLGFVTGIYPG